MLQTIRNLEAACFPGADWTPPQIAASLQSSSFRIVLIQSNGAVQEVRAQDTPPERPAGYALLQCLAAESTLEILRLGVQPVFRRQGMALILLGFLDTINANFHHNEEYLQNNARHLLLEVNARNSAALALYRRHGFEILARRRAYYSADDGSRADGVVLRKTITPSQEKKL